MPSSVQPRTVRRIGAAVVALLGLTVLYLDSLAAAWADPVAPPTLAVGVPWLAILVSLGYLTVSLLAGAGRALQPGDAGDAGESRESAGSDSPG
jgi:hypothetical protein